MDYKIVKNERGSSLVLVLLVTLIFTVLGLSLLSATVNGTKRTELREDDVQATFVAEKGVDELVHSFQTELESGMGTDGLTMAAYKSLLDNTINNFKSVTTLTHSTGSSAAQIINVSPAASTFKRVIEVESTGTVNGEVKTITKKLEVGTDNLPDSFHFALGSYRLCDALKSCDVKGEGNLFLHGGVAIQGDLKVDGDLITTDYGYDKYGTHDEWVPSRLPTIQSIVDPSLKASLALGGEIYYLTQDEHHSYNNNIQRYDFTAEHYDQYSNDEVDKVFEGEDYPVIRQITPEKDPVNIEDNKQLYEYLLQDTTINGEPITHKEYQEFDEDNIDGNTELENLVDNDEELEDLLDKDKSALIFNENLPTNNIYPYYIEEKDRGKNNTLRYAEEFKRIFLYGNNTFKRFSAEEDLYLIGNSATYSTTYAEKGIYVGKNLYIGNTYNPQETSANQQKIKVRGPIYVEEDLIINEANVEFNALIYVKGDVEIQYSVLKGLQENGSLGSLILFAEGNILINNNSKYEETPSYIRGYFYSKDVFEMFGISSNMHVEGGIAGRRIVLNGVKGKVKQEDPNNGQYQEIGDDYFLLPTYQKPEPPRLKVTYNTQIMNTYSNLKPVEPKIRTIDEPIPLERSKK